VIADKCDELCRSREVAKLRIGHCQLTADNGTNTMLGAGRLEAHDASQSHVISEGQGRHAKFSSARYQCLDGTASA